MAEDSWNDKNKLKSSSSCRHSHSVTLQQLQHEEESLKLKKDDDEDYYYNNSSSFVIIPVALETIIVLPNSHVKQEKEQQQQHQESKSKLEDNEPSSSSSYSSASEAAAKIAVSSNNEDEETSSTSSLEQVSIVKCTSCDKSIALLINGRFTSIDAFLHDETKSNGWKKVDSTRDRLVLFILNQIIYREYEVPDEDELQVEYAFPPQQDLSKVLWVDGNAVGFYSVKRKGTLDLDAMECYRMSVVDTLFIRNSYRRKGYALAAIQDVIENFPRESNIGFSVPISLPMIKVLKKHLDLHPADRMRLWEITGCGSEGNCQILWFLLQKS